MLMMLFCSEDTRIRSGCEAKSAVPALYSEFACLETLCLVAIVAVDAQHKKVKKEIARVG